MTDSQLEAPEDAQDAVEEDDELEDDEAQETPSTSRSARLRARRVAQTGGLTVNSVGRSKTKATTTNRLTQAGAPKRILAQQKRRQAIEARKMGHTYQMIADAVGYPSASEARKQVLKGFNEMVQEPAAELRVIQVERLNHLLTLAWGQVQTNPSPGNIQSCLAIMTRIDVLNGTEAAIKVDVQTNTTTNIINVTANEDDYITQIKRFMGVDQNGANMLPLGQNPTPAAATVTQQQGQSSTPLQIQPTAPQGGAKSYPPGMGKPQTIVIQPSPQQKPGPIVLVPDDDEDE